MMLRKYTVGILLVTLLTSAAAPALAQTDLAKFPLLKAVPSDAFITVAAKANPERQFLDDYWAEVHVAFMESGILTDAWEMFTDSMSEENLAMIEDLEERFSKLCAKVEWCDLFSGEMIYAGRLIQPVSAHGSPYEGIVLGRMNGERSAANYTAIKALLGEFVKLVEADYGEGVLAITETKEDDVTIATLAHRDLAGMVFSVATYKDVIAVSFGGPTILNESMLLLQGSAAKKGLASTERFKKAFDQLPPAEDTLVFFDPSLLMTRMGGMFKMMAGSAEKKDEKSKEGESSEPDEGEAAMAMINKLLEDVSIFDYMATVEYTEGHRVFTENVAALKVDAKNRPLYEVLAGGKHPHEFSKFIPKEADTFGVSSGINFKALYGYVRKFLETHTPDGKKEFAEFARIQKEEWKLDLEHDFINALEGPLVSFSIGDDWVLMLKVADEKKFSGSLSRLLNMIREQMGENAIVLTPIKLAGDVKFTQVSHPMMMMMGGLSPPVLGCTEGYLVLASNAKTVEKCLNTASGKHPNITKNQRWSVEAIKPKTGLVDAISFADETNSAAQAQQIIGALSMVMGFANMGMGDAPPQLRNIVQVIPGILAKLGPVVGKMDFYQSSAGVTTFDGQRWVTKSVQNYKDPATREKSESEKDDATPPRKASKSKIGHGGKKTVEEEEDADEEGDE